MNHTPTFGPLETEAWSASITYTAKRILWLMVAGGIGHLLGTLATLTSLPTSSVALGFLAYPVVLLMNSLSPFGVIIWIVFAALLIGVTVFDLNLRHAFGWLLPLQALYTFRQIDPDAASAAWLALVTLLSPFVFFYFLLLLDYLRDEQIIVFGGERKTGR